MDDRVMRFRVGVMFLATLLIAAILLVMFGKLPKLIGTYPIKIKFKNASGVTNYTPVRKCGILIGRVASVELIENDSRVLVTADIQSDKTVYQNESCFIDRDLLGDTALTFKADLTLGKAAKPYASGATLEGKASDDPTGLKGMLAEPIEKVWKTGEALTQASEQLGKAAKRVEDILDEDTQKNFQKVLKNAATSLEAIQEALGDKDNRDKLANAINNLPNTIDNMNKMFGSTNNMIDRFNEPSEKDGKTPIDRLVGAIEMTEHTLQKFTTPLKPGNPPPVEEIATAMENINEITRLMRDIMGRMNRGEGSLGKFMNDPELYDQLSRAAKNVENVSRQLKPILDDARVFSDKIARHPGVIVRDAVKPGVGIK